MTDTSRVSPFDEAPDVWSVTEVDADEDPAAPEASRPAYAGGLAPADGGADGCLPGVLGAPEFEGWPALLGLEEL
jgi:hypothetical protein